MVNTVENAVDSSDLVDPLAGSSPFLFKFFSSFNPFSNPNSDSLLTHLKNMVVRNPDSLVKHAKIILEESKELSETDKTAVPVFDDKSKAPSPTDDKIPHERRPGLGLKPAKFSVKPMPSQPDLNVEPSIDIDKLKDDVLFEAFERMENARKELQRLNGQSFEEMDQNRASLPARRRRPSLLGKSSTYKHLSYTSTGAPLSDEVLVSSKEASDPKITSPIRENSIPATSPMKFSPQTRVSDVKKATSNKASELDELLSIDYVDYDDAGIQNLLLEKLNIKLLDISETSLPVIPDICRRGYGSSIETLTKRKDSIFDVNDNSKATSSKPLNFKLRKSPNNQASPSYSKSPLASISTLNKHISRHTPLKDPFLPSSPEVISYQTFKNRKQPDEIGKRIDSHEEETNEAVTSLGSTGNSSIPIIESDERLDKIGHSDLLVTSKDSHEFGRSPACGEEDIRSSGKNLPSMTGNNIFNSYDAFEWVDEIGKTAQASTRENLFEMRSPTDKEETLENSVADGENNNDRREGRPKSNAVVSKEPKNKKRKVDDPPAVPPCKVNEQSRRHNLAGAGTKWEAGVRRSTRIRMKPLEFWKGERFLYGRVHDSMVSVIGVKYASPSKDADEDAVKVKSFVSDKYKDLIDLASSH